MLERVRGIGVAERASTSTRGTDRAEEAPSGRRRTAAPVEDFTEPRAPSGMDARVRRTAVRAGRAHRLAGGGESWRAPVSSRAAFRNREHHGSDVQRESAEAPRNTCSKCRSAMIVVGQEAEHCCVDRNRERGRGRRPPSCRSRRRRRRGGPSGRVDSRVFLGRPSIRPRLVVVSR